MINKLIDRYSSMLTALCLQLCQNEADAADLFQDTWEKAVRYLHRHPHTEIDNPRAWLVKICTNLYCDRFRRQKTENRQHFDTNEDLELFLQNIPDPDAQRDYSVLYDAMTRLSPKQKSAVVLKYFYGFSDAEIAKMLGIPRSTVHTRIYDALKKLRRDLDENASN